MDRSRLPAYARDMPAAEVYARHPNVFLTWWELYPGLAVIVLAALYLPWVWIGQWALVQVFVSVMEQIVPSIAGLEAEYRSLPLDASKARLSFIHWIGGGLCLLRLTTMPVPVFYEGSTLRLWIGVISYFGLAATPLLAIVVLEGAFLEDSDFWYASAAPMTIFHLLLWVLITFCLSWAWGLIKEYRRRNADIPAHRKEC